jgi:hypothetical protein
MARITVSFSLPRIDAVHHDIRHQYRRGADPPALSQARFQSVNRGLGTDMTSVNENLPQATVATAPGKGQKPRARRRFSADLSALGEPALWGFGGALALGDHPDRGLSDGGAL